MLTTPYRYLVYLTILNCILVFSAYSKDSGYRFIPDYLGYTPSTPVTKITQSNIATFKKLPIINKKHLKIGCYLSYSNKKYTAYDNRSAVFIKNIKTEVLRTPECQLQYQYTRLGKKYLFDKISSVQEKKFVLQHPQLFQNASKAKIGMFITLLSENTTSYHYKVLPFQGIQGKNIHLIKL